MAGSETKEEVFSIDVYEKYLYEKLSVLCYQKIKCQNSSYYLFTSIENDVLS